MDTNTVNQIVSMFQAFLPKLLPPYSELTLDLLSQLGLAILSAWLIMVCLNRTRGLVARLQNRIYKSQLSKQLKYNINTVLNGLKPNAAWISALLIVIFVENSGIASSIYGIVLNELLEIIVLYRVVLLISTYSLESAIATVESFISKRLLDEIQAKAKYCSVWVSVCLIPYQFLFEPPLHSLYSVALMLFLAAAALYEYTRYILPYSASLNKFIARQLPDQDDRVVADAQSSLWVRIKFLMTFIVAHCIKLLLSLHMSLLKLRPYQAMTAKILWLRLEQKQQAEPEEDVLVDERYEKWFGSTLDAAEIMTTENSRYLHEHFDQLIDSWLQEKSTENDFLIHGDACIGKTTAIKHWQASSEHGALAHTIKVPAKILSEQALFNLFSRELEETIESLDDLIQYDQRGDKKVIILDNCENLFLSNIGNFTAYKTLLSIMNLPMKNIFWVFVVGSESYVYLKDVFGRLNQFSNRMEFKPWQSDEIRDLIMLRHKASKRKLSFDELLFASIGNDEMSSYAATADRCFLLLAEKAGGNPALAMAIWAKSASKKGHFTVEIGLPEKPSISFLADYSADLLFVYAALVKHRNLSIDEAAKSTRQSFAVAQRAFKLGTDNGFLCVDHTGRFQVHMYWQSQLINFLQAKNYLHGA